MVEKGDRHLRHSGRLTMMAHLLAIGNGCLLKHRVVEVLDDVLRRHKREVLAIANKMMEEGEVSFVLPKPRNIAPVMETKQISASSLSTPHLNEGGKARA